MWNVRTFPESAKLDAFGFSPRPPPLEILYIPKENNVKILSYISNYIIICLGRLNLSFSQD